MEVPKGKEGRKSKTVPAGWQGDKILSRFKVRERVVIFSRTGVAIHGTVKWAGKYSLQDGRRKPHSVAAVGIETDVEVPMTEMESCLPPKRHYFPVGKGKGSIFIREEEVILEEDFSQGQKPAKAKTALPVAGLRVGSPVQLVQHPSRRGIIKWIGTLPEAKKSVAGVELNGPMEGCGDGEWRGHRYFTCVYKRSFFCPLASLLPDTRTPQSSHPAQAGATPPGNPLQIPEWVEQDQTIPAGQIMKYTGDERGIQGHKNSSHVDATIFALFALSDVFDSLFLDSDAHKSVEIGQRGMNDSPATKVQREISNMLWRGIVNPLRKNGAVRFESVMRLRNKLDELRKIEGVKSADKDPEGFLSLFFKHTLHVEPFIQLKHPFGTEPEFFVKLFVEFDESLKTPTVEILLQKMFEEQQIFFEQVPLKLLVQVPTHREGSKGYSRIIPGNKFNPAPLLNYSYNCHVCGSAAWNKCTSCGSGRDVFFCDTCCVQVHSHEARREHAPEKCDAELELLSVICSANSHYVCFTRDSERKWLFFDSMANRVYKQYYIPRCVDCTSLLNEWVYGGSTERLMAAGPRDLPELVRRFTQDVFMYVYIQPDYGMYTDIAYSPLVVDGDSYPIDQLLNTETRREKELKEEVKQLQDELAVQSLQAATCKRNLEKQQKNSRQLAVQIGQLRQEIGQRMQDIDFLQQQLHQEQERSRLLQDKLDRSAVEEEADVAFCTAKRSEVRTEASIGEGAWGKVEKGMFRGVIPVAVKSLHKAILTQNTVDRLKREVKIMAQVRHPNLVRFIAAVLDEAAERLQLPPMIITELLDINLRKAYKDKRITAASHLTILRDIAYGLHHLHGLQQPIIHRDVSAPNVLLQEQPSGGWLAKVSDFGSANFAKLARTAGEGAVIYTAPEAFPHTASDVDPQSTLMTTKIDVYSYGIVACELIVGEMPTTERYRAMLQQVKSQWVFMYNLIGRCTKHSPLHRPTMANILDELPRPLSLQHNSA